MKKQVFIIIVILAGFNLKTLAKQLFKAAADTSEKQLPDGLYYADVSYYNYASYVSAEYNLKVKVKDGMVIVIHLNNGGVVHYGINNENYLYTGGKLEANRDKKTGKLDYNTQVSISNGRNISSYNINISKHTPDETQ
jgi:hypothetical protein